MQCLVCKKEIDAFKEYGLPPRIGQCPHCRAKPRHRELSWFFQRFVKLGANSEILEVGPSKVATTHFVQPQFIGQARYTSIDIRRLKHHEKLQPPHRFMEMDVTDLKFPDASLDVVIFNNALPYIREDVKAMKEIRRCLKDTGFAIMNVSLELPKTRSIAELRKEKPEIFTDEYLAENGTEWAYGDDYFDRLNSAGLFVWRFPILEFAGKKLFSEQLFRENGELFLCFCSKESCDAFKANCKLLK